LVWIILWKSLIPESGTASSMAVGILACAI
jgi:hypothetical protein